MAETRFQCKFCQQRFVHEDRFLNHKCKQMIRDEQVRSTEGQAAWVYYQEWMKSYQRIVPNIKSFLHSKYFNAFYRFALFVKTVRMPDTTMFIKMMREKDISPTIWTNDQVYSLYLEYLDRRGKPEKHAEITINTLFDIAEDNDVDIKDVFTITAPNQIIQLLRQRKISPWILLNSSKFATFFVQRTNPEERIIIESIIRPTYWKTKFEKHPDVIKKMKKYVQELHL